MSRIVYIYCILVIYLSYPRPSHCEIFTDNDEFVVQSIKTVQHASNNHPVPKGHSMYHDDPPITLDLCDCQVATGAPGGLSCDKEGFFIAHFERQGQWVAGGGAVPLSRAICCRPCIPDDLPEYNNNNHSETLEGGILNNNNNNNSNGDDNNISNRKSLSSTTNNNKQKADIISKSKDDDEDDRPLAIISLGCHPSSDALGIRCESSGRSFVSGFTDAVRVFTAVDTLYPINTAQCCTPALLMPNGDAWEVDRCNCHLSDDPTFPINCGGNATNDALIGFDYFRLSPLGQVVPIGPAKCCSMCLTGKVHPMDDCSELNRCNNNGVCLLGRCECLAGWGGADCSLPTGSPGQFNGRIPAWGIALIVIGSCLLAIFLLTGAAHLAEIIAEAREQRGNESDDDEGQRPLLIRIDADDAGSVGSEDTACEEELEEVEERIEGAIERLRSSNDGSDNDEGDNSDNDDDEGEGGSSTLDNNTINDTTTTTTNDTTTTNITATTSNTSIDNEKPLRNNAMLSYAGIGPLSNVDCVVCMIRPVQTVVVPCGHICLCRRCSRRLNRCPVCRKNIARRQRLFV